MNNKRKAGRPRKPNYKPTISLRYTENLVWDILEAKRSLGLTLTLGELTDLVNHKLARYGIKAELVQKTKKLSLCKRVLNWFRNICK